MSEVPGADSELIQQAKILWDYLRLDQALRKADCVIAMGSHDLRVGDYAAQLVLQGWAPLLICAGGLGRLTENLWKEPEARKFADAAWAAGVAKDHILIEAHSTNTAENLNFSRELLAEKGFAVHSAILVHKPYMERRALATAGIAWPELDCTVTSPPISFEDYPTDAIPLKDVIQIMAGDFQRVILYADKGYQTRQEIPKNAMVAFDYLVERGYHKFLIRDR